MLWEYFYMRSEMVRSAMEDVFGTWPTGKSKKEKK